MKSHFRYSKPLNPENDLVIRRLSDLVHGEIPFRQKQLIASSLLLENEFGISGELRRNEHGKPYLTTGHFVSISHTNDFIAMLIGKRAPVALDIELVHRSVMHVRNRFTTEREKDLVSRVFKDNPDILIWSCKECLFKILNIRGVLFREHLKFVEVLGKDALLWKVEHPTLSTDYVINYFIFEKLLVTYIVE